MQDSRPCLKKEDCRNAEKKTGDEDGHGGGDDDGDAQIPSEVWKLVWVEEVARVEESQAGEAFSHRRSSLILNRSAFGWRGKNGSSALVIYKSTS